MKKTKIFIIAIILILLIGIFGKISFVLGEETDTRIPATLDKNGKIVINVKDENHNDVYDKYDNIYCVDASKHIKSGTYKETATVEINGETAKLTNKANNKEETIYNSCESHKLAAILTTSNLTHGYKSETGYPTPDNEGPLYANRSGAQIALWVYWSTWSKSLPSEWGNIFPYTDYTETIGKKYDTLSDGTKLSEEVDKHLSRHIYNATIHLIEYESNGTTENSQRLILVEPGIPQTEMKIQKEWKDSSGNKIDPPVGASITIKITGYKDNTGKTEDLIEKTVTLSNENGWKATVQVPAKREWNSTTLIKYTVEETTNLPDYSKDIKIESYRLNDNKITYNAIVTFTNTLQTIDIPVSKVWYDDNNQYGKRPESITVKLLADGEDTGKTLILNADNNWAGKFNGLPKYKNGNEIKYTIEEIAIDEYITEITGDQTNGYTITNMYVPRGIEITGKVWLDRPDGKANNINGKLDEDESGLAGIKVTLRQANGQVFDTKNPLAYTTTTKADGTYTIRVNYDDSQNVYKLFENSNTVKERLKTAYVEFEYDGMKYTTVATATTGANTSKAIEDEKTRNVFDNAHSTVNPSTTHPDSWTDKNITAITKNVISSFESYADENKTQITRKEVFKYCIDGDKYESTNPEGAWKDIITGTGAKNRPEHTQNCDGKGHTMATYDVNVDVIQNVNLGLFEREQPTIGLYSDLTKVEVTMNNQKYTYLYNVRSNNMDPNAKDYLKVKFQNKNTYTYRRPVNPADIAYISEGHDDAMQVYVTYEVKIANLSSTLQMTVNNILAAYDSEYEIMSITKGKNNPQNIGYEQLNNSTNPKNPYPYQPTIKLNNLNITLKGGYETSDNDVITITYKVSQDAIKGLLNEDATLNTGYEIYQYSTVYGEKTLYAEQRTGGRKEYAGYDYASHPGNANIQLKQDADGVTRLKSTDSQGNIIEKPEADTDFAPSFVLCKDEDKVLSGKVWEDTDTGTEVGKDNFRVGDGTKSESEKNLANVRVELWKVIRDDDGNISGSEIAKLYKINEETKDAITYTNGDGYYSFGDSGKDGYSVVTDEYFIKFIYGDDVEKKDESGNIVLANGATTLVGRTEGMNARNYKSTIISQNTVLYDMFKNGTVNDTWHLEIPENYSVAVDNVTERLGVEDLQYSNFDSTMNMTAESKPFKMQVEFDANGEGNVSENGEKLNADGTEGFIKNFRVFDFGIIERAREDIVVEKTISHIKVTLANGQTLIEGDPRGETPLPYTKSMGLKTPIRDRDTATNPLFAVKQVSMEIDSELIQGAQLDITYDITVTNNSEREYDYYIGEYDQDTYNADNLRTEFYFFGTNGEGSPEMSRSVEYIVDYMNSGLEVAEISENWKKLKAKEDLLDKGLISETVYNAIKDDKYLIYGTDVFAGVTQLGDGETPHTEYITVRKLLTYKQDSTYDNNVEIAKIDGKIARTIDSSDRGVQVEKTYKPGNYDPSQGGSGEQDDNSVKVTITPPTGATNYIITYVIAGLVGLIVMVVGVVFIKKKVLAK